MRYAVMIILVMGTLILSGCAHYYEHPIKKSQAEFNRDKQECTRIGEREAVRNKTKPCNEVERCLFSKGWRR